MALGRLIGAALCMAFWLLVVVLLPSSAWSATETRGSSAALSRSLDHCGGLDEPGSEEPHVCVPGPTETATVVVTELGPTTTETATLTETATETTTETITETIVEQGEPVCGVDDLPPCEVTVPVGLDDPWLLIAAASGVSLLAAILVSMWGK